MLRQRHRNGGVFVPNRTLRRAATVLAIGNGGKRGQAVTGEQAVGGSGTGGCCDTIAKPCSDDTSQGALAKPTARAVKDFPLRCPACGRDVRLRAFTEDPGPIRKFVTHLGEPHESTPLTPDRGEPTQRGELVRVHHDRDSLTPRPTIRPRLISAVSEPCRRRGHNNAFTRPKSESLRAAA